MSKLNSEILTEILIKESTKENNQETFAWNLETAKSIQDKAFTEIRKLKKTAGAYSAQNQDLDLGKTTDVLKAGQAILLNSGKYQYYILSGRTDAVFTNINIENIRKRQIKELPEFGDWELQILAPSAQNKEKFEKQSSEIIKGPKKKLVIEETEEQKEGENMISSENQPKKDKKSVHFSEENEYRFFDKGDQKTKPGYFIPGNLGDSGGELDTIRHKTPMQSENSEKDTRNREKNEKMIKNRKK